MRNEQTFRFAIVDSLKPLTSIWRAWRWKGDVYVAPRAIAGSYKISLHESGKYRFGFVSDEKAQKFIPEENDRAVFKWEQPAPISPGASMMLQIIFPEPCLLEATGKVELPKNLFNLIHPKAGNATVVSLLLILPGVEPDQIRFASETEIYTAEVLTVWDMPNASRVFLVQHEEAMSADFMEGLMKFRSAIPNMFPSNAEQTMPNRDNSHLRSSVSIHRDDGVVRFVDIDAEHIR